MKLKSIIAVSMCRLALHILRQVDDSYCLEWALPDTDSTPYAQDLTDDDVWRVGRHLDTQFIRFVDWAALLTFLFAPFWLALFLINDGDTKLTFLHQRS